MGCDIHLHIEYSKKLTGKEDKEEKRHWMPIGGQFSDRIYGMFAKLADVRNYSDIIPISKPRGLPLDVGYSAMGKYTLYINDDYQNDDGVCSKAQAEEWVGRGDSIWIDTNHISNPDWHSASWVTTEEMKEAVYEIFYDKEEWRGDFTVFRCILVLMQEIENCGMDCRAVFWFDN